MNRRGLPGRRVFRLIGHYQPTSTSFPFARDPVGMCMPLPAWLILLPVIAVKGRIRLATLECLGSQNGGICCSSRSRICLPFSSFTIAARMYRESSSIRLFSTPSPVSKLVPRLHWGVGALLSAALRYHFKVSIGSFDTVLHRSTFIRSSTMPRGGLGRRLCDAS